ncbi:hypothetical protein [Streptomyces sp. NPDC049949]
MQPTLALVASGERTPITSEEIAERYGVGERTAQRLIREAREHTSRD